MIKSITVINYRGESLKIDLYDPESSGFAIQEVTGIGPGSATINLSDISTGDGSLYNSARIPSRNIGLSLIYIGTSVEEIRQMSYKYFPIKKKVTLIFETENRTAEISGYVESNEPNIFSEREGSEISVLCPDPFFRAYGISGNKTVYLSGVEPVFKFSFSSNSLKKYGNGYSVMNDLVMSVLNTEPIKTFYYDGDSDTDVVITIHATGEASGIIIDNPTTGGYMKINDSMIAGDDIIITTRIGAKTIIRRRNFVDTNILNSLDKNANWFRIYKGYNTFAFGADEGLENLEIRLEYRMLYEGV